jgi:hypothetical protein
MPPIRTRTAPATAKTTHPYDPTYPHNPTAKPISPAIPKHARISVRAARRALNRNFCALEGKQNKQRIVADALAALRTASESVTDAVPILANKWRDYAAIAFRYLDMNTTETPGVHEIAHPTPEQIAAMAAIRTATRKHLPGPKEFPPELSREQVKAVKALIISTRRRVMDRVEEPIPTLRRYGVTGAIAIAIAAIQPRDHTENRLMRFFQALFCYMYTDRANVVHKDALNAATPQQWAEWRAMAPPATATATATATMIDAAQSDDDDDDLPSVEEIPGALPDWPDAPPPSPADHNGNDAFPPGYFDTDVDDIGNLLVTEGPAEHGTSDGIDVDIHDGSGVGVGVDDLVATIPTNGPGEYGTCEDIGIDIDDLVANSPNLRGQDLPDVDDLGIELALMYPARKPPTPTY